MVIKEFKLKSENIENIAVGYGGCVATDMIKVHGEKVCYMYREETNNEMDRGWCFMCGKETQEYMDDPANHGIYDINTIANYSPDITEFLDAPYGSKVERNSEGKLDIIKE